MAVESSVQVAPDGGGKQVDTFVVTLPNGAVQHRQAVVLADPQFAANTQNVTASGDAQVRIFTVEDLLLQMLVEMRCMNTILQATLNSNDDLSLLRIAEQSVAIQQTQ